MQDENLNPPQIARRQPGSARALVAVGLVAFVLGAVLTGWIAWQSGLTIDRVLNGKPAPLVGPASIRPAPTPVAPLTSPTLAQGAFDQRLAALEQRLARLDLQAEAVSGNTARAEGLLIAFAARRLIDRGAPLGYLEDQLKVRFGDAQPNAVATIAAAATQPVTLEQLSAQLRAMAPALTEAPRNESGWARAKREIASLFVIRSESVAQDPAARIDRALLALHAGQMDQAITSVRLLPGGAGASAWIAAAQRYAQVHRALDLIESTALIEPRLLGDATGRKVETPSPLTTPPGV